MVFKEVVDFGVIIIIKIDGYVVGGGVILVVVVICIFIVFIGIGEYMLDLECFVFKNFIFKLLGMGDMVGLVEYV